MKNSKQDIMDCYLVDEKRSIRVLIRDKKVWFSGSDILECSGFGQNYSYRHRLGAHEMLNVPWNGSSIRCVSLSGLVGMLPAHEQYWKHRRIVVKLIVEYGPMYQVVALSDNTNKT